MSKVMKALGAAILTLWGLAALDLRLLALYGGLAIPGVPVDRLILEAFLEMSVLLPALWGVLVLLESRPPALLLAAAAALPAAWLGRELALGGAVMRSGWGTALEWGVPVLAAVGVGVGMAWWRRRPRSRLLGIAIALVVAYGLRRSNRTLYVGLYPAVHQILSLMETLLVGGVILEILRWPSRETSRSWGRVALGVLFCAAGVMAFPPLARLAPLPEESVRSRFSRQGFHLAQVQRLHARWRRGAPSSGGADAELLASLDAWNRFAAENEGASDAERRAKFNLVWITIDTLRADHVGAIGGKDGLTPRIDAFADNAAVFTRCWAQYPSTLFSSESMFHGRYPTATALYRSMSGKDFDDAPSPGLAAVLRGNGFKTAASVAFTEEWLATPTFKAALAEFDLVNPDREGAPSTAGKYFADSAMKALDRLRADRFFLWLHLFDPHHPYEDHGDLTHGSGEEDRYAGEVRYVDRQVGRVLDHLKQLDLDRNTVVVIGSDHGEAFGEHNSRWHASSLYPEQLHVPLLIRVPGWAGRRIEEPVENVDLFGTLQSLLLVEKRTPNQSTDLTPLIQGEADGAPAFPSVVLAELPGGIQELSAASKDLSTIVRGDWQLIRHGNEGFSELYDLGRDPGATEDLAPRETERRKSLETSLVTLVRRNRSFGRKVDERAERTRRLEETRTLLHASDPFQRLDGLTRCRRWRLVELGPKLTEMALDENEVPELRYELFRLVADWRVPGWRKILEVFMESDNPVFVWAANDVAGGRKGEPWETLRRLEFLWGRGRRGEWTETMRDLLASQYAAPEIKESALGNLPLLPRPIQRELAMHLLVGWDPGFDRKVRSELKEIMSAEVIDRLALAKTKFVAARELRDQHLHRQARSAYEAAAAALPAESGQAWAWVEMLRSSIVLDDRDRAVELVDRLAEFLNTERARKRSEFWQRLEEDVDELDAYEPAQGLLTDDLAIRVVELRKGLEAYRFVWPGDWFSVDVVLRNDSERALPSGAWDRGGRLRVLWYPGKDKDPYYGTEVVLERGLLPGQEHLQQIRIQAPPVAGSWLGRIILSQQGGPRFHRVEDDRGTFGLMVWNPDAPVPPIDMDAAEIFNVFKADPSIRSWSLSSEKLWVMGICTGYEGGLVSRPLTFDGTLETMQVELGWLSSIPDAKILRLEFIPLDGAPAFPPASVILKPDGVHRMSPPIPLPKLMGRYRLRLVIGLRQGMFEIMRALFR